MKKAKILVIVSLTICLFAMVLTAFFYVRQKQYATQLDILNKELEHSKLKLDDTNTKLFDALKEISSYVPDSIALKSETINRTKNLELEGLVQNIFSPIKSQRLSSTETLTTKWTEDETLIPYLLDYSKDRFGQESYNMSGIINAIVVLNRMKVELLEQNRDKVSEFINHVERLEDRNQTQGYLETLKNRMN
ncbi:hypothetical protein LX77_00471 [Gelidibacter algens]|jgi:hypothetical protein|uniref:Uncharacterized protein n=1 Tax=Gelidibacter algens TaxID=49280 RepID=A0A1A7R240_9FLAO|nr:hypothetical protein [Gelidibacter algens]OBX25568.1 hypothetical protein A9996_08980 [Gelidibacter algens]RAJ27897.1 hypothetical protein LX77_00471 [Gelidibacter algens]